MKQLLDVADLQFLWSSNWGVINEDKEEWLGGWNGEMEYGKEMDGWKDSGVAMACGHLNNEAST